MLGDLMFDLLPPVVTLEGSFHYYPEGIKKG